MKNLLTALIFVLVGVNQITLSQEKLDIDGAIILKNSEVEDPIKGTIRFNPENSDFEGFNGFNWVSLSGVMYETGELTDPDNNTYLTIKIGTQEWMAENLRTSTFHDAENSSITYIEGTSNGNMTWKDANDSAYTTYDITGTSYKTFTVNKFGHLYNWYAMRDSRGICPNGWKVPSGSDWSTLNSFLISSPAGKMKKIGTYDWLPPNTGATNTSGFTAIPSGSRNHIDGSFNGIGLEAIYWDNTDSPQFVGLNKDSDELFYFATGEEVGLSIRCVKE